VFSLELFIAAAICRMCLKYSNSMIISAVDRKNKTNRRACSQRGGLRQFIAEAKANGMIWGDHGRGYR
jgi:hypothetical protein